MEQEVTNYARFYALLKKLPGADKETLVYQFTGGRTKSLRQMSEKEYESMCNEMETNVARPTAGNSGGNAAPPFTRCSCWA